MIVGDCSYKLSNWPRWVIVHENSSTFCCVFRLGARVVFAIDCCFILILINSFEVLS